MKKFKELLKEFKGIDDINNPPRNGGNEDDSHNQIMRFMDRVPFRFNTKRGDLIHFDSALNAAKTFFKHLEQHEEGHNHAVQTETPHMIKYFQKSAQTHEDALDLITDMVKNHEDLPTHLRNKVGGAFSKIQSDVQEQHEEQKAKMADHYDSITGKKYHIGERVMQEYGARPIEIRGEEYHPHQHDQMHHLEGVVADLEDFMDESGAPAGYVIRREERTDI